MLAGCPPCHDIKSVETDDEEAGSARWTHGMMDNSIVTVDIKTNALERQVASLIALIERSETHTFVIPSRSWRQRSRNVVSETAVSCEMSYLQFLVINYDKAPTH